MLLALTINYKGGQTLPEYFSPKGMYLYIEDYETGTSRMTISQLGFFQRLLNHEWRYGFIPLDLQEVCRICGIFPDELEPLLPVFTKFIEYKGMLFNDKLETVRRQSWDKSVKASQSVIKRHEKRGKKCTSVIEKHPNSYAKGLKSKACVSYDRIATMLLHLIHLNTLNIPKKESSKSALKNNSLEGKYSEKNLELIKRFDHLEIPPDKIVEISGMYPDAFTDDKFLRELVLRTYEADKPIGLIIGFCKRYKEIEQGGSSATNDIFRGDYANA